MGDYVHLFADETERTQYERSAQYNEPYISATDDTFDAEYNKRQDKQYAVKYTDLENSMHDFTYVEYDAEIEYLEITGTQYINTGIYPTTLDLCIEYETHTNLMWGWVYNQYPDNTWIGTSQGGMIYFKNYRDAYKWSSITETMNHQWTKWKYDMLHGFYKNGTLLKAFTTTLGNTAISDIPLCFGRYYDKYVNAIGAGQPSKIKSLKISRNDEVLRDMIPVRIGDIGYMYDKISGELFGNAGTDNFILGPDKDTYDAQVEYLQSTGTQYIDTGVLPTSNTKIVTTATILSKGCGVCVSRWTDSPQSDTFGIYTGGSSQLVFYYGNCASNYYISIPTSTIAVTNKKYTYTLSREKLNVSEKNTSKYNNVVTFDNNISSTCTLYAFNFNNKGSALVDGTCRIYRLLIYEGDTLIRDFIPVRKNQEGCLYDVVNKKLYKNQGSGNFIIGQDVIPVEYLQSSGTQYINTGIIPDANTGFRLACEYIGNYSTSESLYAFGLRKDANDTRWTIGYNTANFYYGYGVYGVISNMSQTSTKITSDVCSNATLNYLNDKKFTLSSYCNGAYTNGSVNLPTLPFTPQTDIRLFGSSGIVDNYTKWKGRISFAQITQGNKIIRDFIPIRINQTGYMYDCLTGETYANNGTGTFICGPDKESTAYDCKLQYLESTGTQYINLNYYPAGTDIVEVAVKSTVNDWNYGNAPSTYPLWNPIFGMQSSGTVKFWGTYVKTSNGYCMYYYNQNGGSAVYPWFSPALTADTVKNLYRYRYYKNTCYRNSTKLTLNGGTGTINSTKITVRPIYLFAVNDRDTIVNTSKLQIYWFKLRTETGQLIFDMIPVSKNGVGYMYDRVSGRLFGNAGSGQFVLGPDVV